MQDDKSQKENDFTEDKDLELTDLEGDADFTDDSWDEFDDDATTKTADMPASVSNAKQKSFVQKYFNLIVIAVIVAGAGVFFLGRGATTPPVPDAQDQAAAETADQNGIIELSDSSNPPMPAPIDSASEAQDISEGATSPPAMPENLTPLPESQQLAQVELSDLNTPAPEAPADTLPLPEENIPAETADSAPPAPVAEVTPEQILPDTVPPTVPAAPAAIDPAIVAKVDSLEQNLSSLRGDLEGKIDSTNSKIDSLVASIQSLESKIEDVSRKAAEAPAPAEKSIERSAPKEESKKPEPVLNEQPRAAAPPKKSSKAATVPSAAPVSKSSQWVLRSAQPGKASLSPKGSNEMQTVVVGDTLKGLGRIMSISLENGVWTVRGTKGFVSR